MKKLIIVCEERLRSFGDFLSQLISLQDDKGDTVVGIKDGSAAAQVWTEKEYVANSAQISSEQYILFIGDSKLIKDKRNFMKEIFSKFGMKYGWLGKQAVLFVDGVVSLEEYEAFVDFASGYQPEIKKLVESNSDVIPIPEFSKDEVIEEVSGDAAEIKEDVKKGLVVPKFLKNAVEDISKSGIKAINIAARNINKSVNNRKIEEQEYSCLVMMFYLNGLATFLGLNEG